MQQQNLVSSPTLYTNLCLLQDKIFREFFAHRIGIIQTYNATDNTATITMVDVETKIVNINDIINQNYSPIPNVPIYRNATKNAGFTRPVLVGDTVLMLFNDTNIDAFLQNPSIQPPFIDVMHDINNALAIPFDFSAWIHNNTGSEMFYGNIKISLSGTNITFTTNNLQQITIDQNGNMIIAGNLTVNGNLIVSGGNITMGAVELSDSGGKESINGIETAVVGGITIGDATTQTITTSGQ